MIPTCKKCSRPHYNMQPCSVGETNAAKLDHERLMAEANLTPKITPREGWHPWRQEPMENVRLYGGLQVIKSDLKQTRDGWKER